MTRPFPLTALVALAFFVLLIQLAAFYWHLYFQFWWLDIPLHMIGGLWITLFGLVLYYRLPRVEEVDRSGEFIVAFAVAATLTIGLFWEIYEFGVDRAVGDTGHGLADTLLDLVNDLIGAMVGAWIFIGKGYHQQIVP